MSRIILYVCGLLLVTGAFQNCVRNAEFQYSSKLDGNGDGYTGKPDMFQYFDPQNPCIAKDLNGDPLPNHQIFVQDSKNFAGRAPHLVREACQDRAPRELASTEYQLNSAGDRMTFQGRSLSAYTPSGDFDLLASGCPTGQTLIPGANRTNLFLFSQDWRERVPIQGWNWHSGMGAYLDGAVLSLPTYRLERNDPGFLEGFRRISQFPTLQQNTGYTFSFFSRAGNVTSVTFRSYHAANNPALNEYLIVDIDLLTGTSSVAGLYNLPAPEIRVIPFGSGFYTTIHYRTGSLPDGMTDIGVAPTAGAFGQFGDFVFATAAQLERTGDFCQ